MCLGFAKKYFNFSKELSCDGNIDMCKFKGWRNILLRPRLCIRDKQAFNEFFANNIWGLLFNILGILTFRVFLLSVSSILKNQTCFITATCFLPDPNLNTKFLQVINSRDKFSHQNLSCQAILILFKVSLVENYQLCFHGNKKHLLKHFPVLV